MAKSLDFEEDEKIWGSPDLSEEEQAAEDEGLPPKPDFEEIADEERARTDETTATPTELAGGGASEDVPGHDDGPAEL